MPRRPLRPMFLAAIVSLGATTALPAGAAPPDRPSAQKAGKKRPKGAGGKHAPPPMAAPPPPKVIAEPAPPHTPALVIERLTLDNGLRVVLAPDPRAPVVAVAVAYDVGSRDEERGATGLSALLARLFGQGSANVLRGEHERLLDTRGAGDAAATAGLDRLVLSESAPAGELSLLLWLEADRMKSLQLSTEAVESQKRALAIERAAEDADPVAAGRARLRELVFQASFPLEHDPRGAVGDLAGLRAEQARALFDARCGPSSATLSLTGDFEVDHAVALVHRFFDTARKQEHAPPSSASAAPEQTSQRTSTLDDPRARTTTVLFGFALPPLGTDDHDALEVAAFTLASGPGARLPARLVLEKGLATGVNGHLEGQRGPDLLTLTVTVAEGAPPAEAERLVVAELESLAKTGPTDAELAVFRAHREAQAFRSLADAPTRARLLAEAELVNGDARTVVSETARMASVSRDKVRAAVARWLSPTRRTVVVVGRPHEGDDAPAPKVTRPSAPAGPPPVTPHKPKPPRGHR